MAFNNTYYPQYYQNYQNPYTMQYMQQNQAQLSNSNPQNPQIQSGGFVPVPSEAVARSYPVAPGNSVTFKDESLPYVYTKTMGFSQLDKPIFDKYRLVKEDSEEGETENPQVDVKENISKIIEEDVNPKIDKFNSDMNDIREDLDKVWDEVNALKRKSTTTKRKEVGSNDT